VVAQLKSFLRENHMLVIALVVQAIAIVAYAVKLEQRVMTLETRGAEYSVARLNAIDQKLTAMEGNLKEHEQRINRMLAELLKDKRP
jgi:Tfp pilus assembly protein PilO